MNTKTLAILTMVALALTIPLASASASDWTQFHYDVEHTGYTTSSAPNTGDIAWISDDIGAHSASSVTIADGMIFVYCWDYLVCMDEYTGAVLWNVSVENAKTNRSQLCSSWVTPTYHDGKVFLPAARTYCFNATDGAEIWAFTAPTGLGAVDGSVAIAEGKVFTSDWDGGHYYCLDEVNGTEIWNFTVDGKAQSTPAVSVADDRVFFCSYDGVCIPGGVAYCVNTTTGAEIWNFTTDNSFCGSVAIGDDMVYLPEYNFYGDGALYALYSENGTIKWNKTIQRTDSTPALAYGNIYVCGGCKGFSDLMTYCFNATTGELIWNTSASDEIGNWKCSPAVADGKVFVGKPYFEAGVMDYVGTYALDAITGEIVWSYSEGGSSPAVADGKVFTIGSGRVYAFGSPIRDWAQFHHDTANTGSSPANAPDMSHTKWISEDIGAVTGSQAMIVGDQVFVYANDEVYGISRETGTTIWNTAIPGDTQAYGSWASPTYNDGVLFVSAGYNLTRIDAATGTVLQQIAFPDGNVYSCNGGPTVADGMVFVGSGLTPYGDGVARSHYYAFDENDLTDEKWNITNGVSESATSTPAVAANRVVFGNGSSLTCADEANGDVIWSTPLVGSVGGSAATDVLNDRIYVTTYTDYSGDAGLLYAIDFTTGAIDWNQSITYSDSTPAISGGLIYVSGSVNAPGVTYCFDHAGVQQWTVPCGFWTVSPVVADGKLFTGRSGPWSPSEGSSVYNATTGALIWQYEHAGSSLSVAEDADGNGIVVSVGTDGMVYAFGGEGMANDLDWTQFHHDIANTGNSPANAPDTNQVKWISENISAAEGSQAIIVGDRVFVYSSAIGADDAICALNRVTGDVEWSATFPGETSDWGSSTTPAYADGVVYAAAGYNVTSFDAETGTKLQEIAFPDGGYLSNGGVTVADGMVFVGSGDGANYYALNVSDLTDVVWNYTPTLSRAYSTPAVADDRVIFGDAGWGYDDGYLYCVNEFTGDLVWSTNLTGLVWGSAAIDAANNRVYIATAVDWDNDKGKLYALTFDTGAIQWSGDINYTSSTPAVSGEYIYVAASGAAPGVTYCFDSSGVEQWNVPTGSRKISPAVADGKLFTGNVGLSGMASEGTEGINVYDATTGALIWQYEHAGSSPSVAEDADGSGIIVSVGTDGMVYAFGGTKASDWTQFHYDTANTGSSQADAPDTNHVKWISKDIGAVTGSQAMIMGDMVFVYANDEIYGISRDTGTTIWNTSIPGDTQSYGSWASPAYADGVLFVSAGYNLTRIDAATGTVLQQIAFPDGNIYSCNGGPTVADGVVFVGSGLTPWGDDVARSHYYAFDENDLTDEKWNITNGASESAASTPAVAANRVVFGNGSSLTCADEANGDIIWSTTLVGSVGGSAAIDAANDRVYVTTYVWGGQSTLYALDFTNGVEDWNATINYTSSTPAISGDYIYVSGGEGDEQGHTYCFNSAGVEQWNVSCGRWTMSPAIAGGKLFTGNIDPFTSDVDGISAFNAITGAPIWSYEHTGSSPSVTDNILVSIGNDGRVYAFSDSDVVRGDANHDGDVTTTDAAIALQMAVGAVSPNGEADVNRDGRVTSLDALMILQTAAGAITI